MYIGANLMKTVSVPALMQLIFSCKKINKRGREKKREKRKKIRVVGAERELKGGGGWRDQRALDWVVRED